LLVLFAVEIAIVSLMRYVTGGDTPPPPIAANAFAWPFLAIHTISAGIALLVGPLQFVRRLSGGFSNLEYLADTGLATSRLWGPA